MNKGDFVLGYSLVLVLICYLNPVLAFIVALAGCFYLKDFKYWIVLLLVLLRCFLFYQDFDDAFKLDLTPNYILEARICEEPDIRLDKINYILCITKLVELKSNLIVNKDLQLKVLLKYGLYPEFEYGDLVKIKAKIEIPFETEEFSYKNYLKIFGVHFVLNTRDYFTLINQESSFLKQVYKFKNRLITYIERLFNEPYASLINGLLLGARKGFSVEVTEFLAITGLTHIVAVSGYNISLVILFIDKLFVFVPRNIRFYVICIFLALFAIITGLSASVLRATIMGVISIAVIQYGYSANFVRAILLAAFLMCVWNPFILMYDLGFQLSFFSTLGVVILAKKINIQFLPDFLGIKESFILTVSSQIATLPTIVYYFGTLSLISPIANVLVAPFLPVFMLLGFLSFVLAWIYPLKLIFTLMVETLGFVFFEILKFTANVPFASIVFTPKNELLLVVAIVLVIIFCKRKS